MIRPRISPILLLKDTGSEKTKCFKKYKYLGDIINNIRIFNELKVDELSIFDIGSCDVEKFKINFDLLLKIAREANMPLCYGGGISKYEDAERLVSIGFEKISLCQNALNEELASCISSSIGNQSLVLHFDYKHDFFGRYKCFINRGQKKIKLSFEEILDYIVSINPGEVAFQAIDLDGTKKGFDQKFIQDFRKNFPVPVKFIGGCSGYDDIEYCHKLNKMASFGVGAHFILHGKYDAVLPSYETPRFL